MIPLLLPAVMMLPSLNCTVTLEALMHINNFHLQVTSDWSMQKGTGCTEGHSGTSAAAPLAAGMVALMLQVRPCLSWRDVQHIIAFTATKVEGRFGKLVAQIHRHVVFLQSKPRLLIQSDQFVIQHVFKFNTDKNSAQ